MDEIKKIRARIVQIQDYERYMFHNLSFEANFPEAYQVYEQNKDKVLQLIADTQKLELDLQDLAKNTETQLKAMAESLKIKVKKDDVCAEFSIETDVINMIGRELQIETDNFKVNDEQAYFDGTVTAVAGEIGGWKIEGNNLVGQKLKSGEYSSISGGTIKAGKANTYLVDVAVLDFNPNYEYEVHTIDLRNAEISTSIDIDEDTNFGSITVHGEVTLEGENSLECGQLDCTSLTARGTSKYITIFCDEIVTEDETWSDIRLKKGIREMSGEEAEAFVMDLRPVRYRYRKDKRPGAGFIAQDIKRLCDRAGYETMVEMQKGYYGIGYRQIIPLLVKQIQNNMERIQVLKDGREKVL